MSTIPAPWNKLLPMHDQIHKSHLVVKKLWKKSILKYLPFCEQTWFAIFNESFISEETRYSKYNSKWKEIRTSEETSYNVLFYFQVLENSHNLLTTIKANVLAIYNPKHFRTKKKLSMSVCVQPAVKVSCAYWMENILGIKNKTFVFWQWRQAWIIKPFSLWVYRFSTLLYTFPVYS